MDSDLTEDRDAESIRGLELSLLNPEDRSSAERVAALLADDFVEFGSSGSVFDKRQVIDGLVAEPARRRTAEGFRIRMLAENVALVTYRSVRSDPNAGPEFRALRSSIWKRVDGRWQMIFHQGTPAA